MTDTTPRGIDRGASTLTAEASRLFRVYKTISSMLSKRGYMVSREMRDMSPGDFTQRFGEFPTREGLTILVVSIITDLLFVGLYLYFVHMMCVVCFILFCVVLCNQTESSNPNHIHHEIISSCTHL